jgi:hypothetical protein
MKIADGDRRRRLVALLCLVAVASIAGSRSGIRAAQLPVPSALPLSDEKLVSCVGFLMDHTTTDQYSIALVQVLETDTLPGYPSKPKPEKEEDIPVVKGARLAVIKTLHGPPVPAQLDLVNPLPPVVRGPFGKLEVLLTRRMRQGEYWLLPFEIATGKFDLDAFSGKTRLRGLDDPAISLFERHLRWNNSKDVTATFDEVKQTLLDPKEPLYSRSLAQFAMLNLPDDGLRRRDLKSPLYAAAQRVAVELLKQSNTPEELRTRAISSIEIDPTTPIARGSDDEFKLRYLLRMLFDDDPQTAARAGERLYFMNIKSGMENGKPVAYFYPDIIEALQMRDEKDRAEGPRGIGTGILNNLILAHRRSPADVPSNMTVVTRRLP